MAKKLAIAWIDLKFSFKSILGKSEKAILNYLNGSLEFETITALMGPNGSGKTILLKCLNGSNKSCLGKETKIYLSTEEKIRTCFISQDPNDHLLKGLEVKESLIYASKLKNSDSGVEVDHEMNANNLMTELMINITANTVVENISGGQQKRLSIALELTSTKKPNILFIDEPTSGLDSDSAEVVSFR
jgi:ABC-type multidrug transport system ATPase subunit